MSVSEQGLREALRELAIVAHEAVCHVGVANYAERERYAHQQIDAALDELVSRAALAVVPALNEGEMVRLWRNLRWEYGDASARWDRVEALIIAAAVPADEYVHHGPIYCGQCGALILLGGRHLRRTVEHPPACPQCSAAVPALNEAAAAACDVAARLREWRDSWALSVAASRRTLARYALLDDAASTLTAMAGIVRSQGAVPVEPTREYDADKVCLRCGLPWKDDVHHGVREVTHAHAFVEHAEPTPDALTLLNEAWMLVVDCIEGDNEDDYAHEVVRKIYDRIGEHAARLRAAAAPSDTPRAPE